MEHFAELASSKTSEELLVMVYQWEEWSPELLRAVEEELSERKLLPSDIAGLREQRIKAESLLLSKGKEASFGGLVAGWILCFGFAGVGIGYHYAFSKVPSKYTKQVFYKYDKKSRNNGRILFYTSLAISCGYLVVKMVPEYSF